jgi:hypothetical protein
MAFATTISQALQHDLCSTTVKQGMPRVWEDGQARLAFPMAACHVLVQWQGF